MTREEIKSQEYKIMDKIKEILSKHNLDISFLDRIKQDYEYYKNGCLSIVYDIYTIVWKFDYKEIDYIIKQIKNKKVGLKKC